MTHDVVGVAKHWDVAALGSAVRHEHDARVCRRLLDGHLLQGHSTVQTAGRYMLGKGVIYDWVRRFDARGIEALRDRSRSDEPPHLARGHEASFLAWLHQGSPPNSSAAKT